MKNLQQSHLANPTVRSIFEFLDYMN